MADKTEYELIIEKITKVVAGMARFDNADTLIRNPEPEEYERAILDGVEDINLFKPVTSYDLETLYNKGSRWVRLLYLATEINIYRLLVKDWVANGMDVDLGELSLSSKLSDYQSLLSDLESKFQETLAQVKAGGPFVTASSFSTKQGMGLSATGSRSAYLQALKNQLDKNNTVY